MQVNTFFPGNIKGCNLDTQSTIISFMNRIAMLKGLITLKKTGFAISIGSQHKSVVHEAKTTQ